MKPVLFFAFYSDLGLLYGPKLKMQLHPATSQVPLASFGCPFRCPPLRFRSSGRPSHVQDRHMAQSSPSGSLTQNALKRYLRHFEILLYRSLSVARNKNSRHGTWDVGREERPHRTKKKPKTKKIRDRSWGKLRKRTGNQVQMSWVQVGFGFA